MPDTTKEALRMPCSLFLHPETFLGRFFLYEPPFLDYVPNSEGFNHILIMKIRPHPVPLASFLRKCSVLLLLAAWILPASRVLADGVLDLITLSPSPPPDAAATLKTASGQPAHVLDIHFDLLASGLLTTGAWIRVEPEPGVLFTARISRITVDVNGTFSLLAPLVDREHAFLSLSVSDNLALGDVRLPDEQRRYRIRFAPPLDAHISEGLTDDEIDELPPGPALIPPTRLPDKALPETSDAPAPRDNDAGTVIDIMIVYTPAAAAWASSYGGGIHNVIAQAMTRAQQALDNSAVSVTLRLVHSAQISYTESGNSLTDIGRLQKTSDGYMDIAHTWRTQYGADIVSLFAQVSDTGGLGYLLNTTAGSPAYAFNLNRVQQAASSYTVIHEIGHNLGAHHHKAQNVQPGPGLYSYAAGWRWTASTGSRYCSVMTYAEGTYFSDGLTHTRIAYFSNPAVSHLGTATGHAADGDNARTLNNVRSVVAAYRPTVNLPFWLVANAIDNRVMLRWEDPLECGFSNATVHLRVDSSAYPAATNQGTLVYQGSGSSFLHTNVVSGQPHYYTIWVSNDGSTFVEP